jgi:hypothetical protein
MSSLTPGCFQAGFDHPNSPNANSSVDIIAPALERALATLPAYQGWTLIPMVELQRGQRVVVVFWPALSPEGEISAPNVFAMAFDQLDISTYQPLGNRIPIRDRAQAQTDIINALGGNDFTVRPRYTGARLDRLGPELVEHFRVFSDAASMGDRTRAVQAGISLSRLLPLDRVAYENSAAQLLWYATRYSLNYQTYTLPQGSTATVVIDVMSGTNVYRRLDAQCAPSTDNPQRWVVVNPE